MEINSNALRARAKRAYEFGRLRSALGAAAAVTAMSALSLVAGQRPVVTALVGSVLLLLSVGFRYRGQTLGRAVIPGLLAGSVPLILPLLLRSSGYCCFGGSCFSGCLIGCITGGVVAGATLGIASAAEQQRWTFLTAAALLTSLAGMLGCAIVGAAGIAGMALAVVATSLPLAVVASRRAT